MHVPQRWNVNMKTCLFIVWNPHWGQQTLQFTPLVLELFLVQSHLLWEEFSICALCCSYSQSLQFSFLVPPGTHHCWVDRGSVIWEAYPTPLHMTGHVLPLCESCSWTTLPCLQYPTSSLVYPMSTRAAPHEMALLCSGWEANAGLLRDSQVV